MYKGKWVPPKIKNPLFKGVWKANQIENPDYFEDLKPSNFATIGGLGIEIWTMDEKISFNNFLIGNDINSALNFAEKEWKPKHESERAQQKEKEGAGDRKSVV